MDFNIPAVSVSDLHKRLGSPVPLDYPASSLKKALTEWKMELDDSPIFRYLYRTIQPKRHLEFGTWQGDGVIYCLEESNSTVWTINLLEGEKYPDGSWAYPGFSSFPDHLPLWSIWKKLSRKNYICQTDALGFIGKHYMEKGMGNRVCQIYCDSRQWDTSNYPDGFFDTVLIDGGHQEDTVRSDTQKALSLLRPGGIIMWHDFCPDEEVYNRCSSTRGVMDFIRVELKGLKSLLKDIFWVNPSWILIGIKSDANNRES